MCFAGFEEIRDVPALSSEADRLQMQGWWQIDGFKDHDQIKWRMAKPTWQESTLDLPLAND
jgi:hypothetical protein